MRSVPIYQVDAFADRAFTGNAAAVCPLESWLPDDLLQSIAAENNLSETAFFVPEEGGFHLRWFTPVSEVDLCGHATLASAHVLFHHLGHRADLIRFSSKSGPLTVARGILGSIELDFPSRPPVAVTEDEQRAVAEALRVEPVEVLASSRDFMAVLESEEMVRSLMPDFVAISRLSRIATMVTAISERASVDFVSRFFAPAESIDEDPVTGSAHCTLVPYWAGRLGKEDLEAQQVSQRGGHLSCELMGDRVKIAGRAITYLEGRIRF
jgi:PhzF family phenazine biosynthesis protein